MTLPSVPSVFFDRLRRLHEGANSELRARGATPTGFACVFSDSGESWRGLRAVKATGVTGDGRTETVIYEIQPELFEEEKERPVRRVRPPSREERPVRRVCRAERVVFRVSSMIEVEEARLPEVVALKIRRAFSYRNPEFYKKHRLGLWLGDTPEQVESFEEAGGVLALPRGGSLKIRECFEGSGVEPSFEDHRLVPEQVDMERGPRAEPAEEREDQEALVGAILEREQGLIRAATGSGKTEVVIEAIRRARLPALVVVWSSGLHTQWVRRIMRRMGWSEDEVGVIGEGKVRIRPITIAMQQSLYRRPDRFADCFGFLAGDEVQRWAARTFRDVVSAFPAKYRIGVSADERRKDGMDDLVRDAFGEVIAEVSREDAIAQGRICDVEIVAVPTGFDFPLVTGAPREERGQLLGKLWGKLLDGIAGDDARTAIGTRIAAAEVRRGCPTLLFVDRQAHAQEVARQLAVDHRVPCGVALGGAENKEVSEDTLARLDSGRLLAAAATSCIYQGTDIPRLRVGIVMSPTANNEQLLEQQIGRLRRKFPGKVRGRLYYLLDEAVFPGHLANLRKWYGDLVRVAELPAVLGGLID